MRTMRKIVSILLAVTLLAALSLSVFADANSQHTITISNPDAQEAHAYKAYQVFAGDWDGATNRLSNVSWGSGVDAEALLAELNTMEDFADCTSAAQVVAVLSGYASRSDEVRAFAAVVDKHLAAEAGAASGDAEHPAVINVTGDGYYYVTDVSEALAHDTYSDYILLVEGNVLIEAKDTTGVHSEKKVKDINDSTLEGSDWQDSADYDIGDPVPFQICGTVAADYDLYTTYKLIFHDQESAGLTFDHITGVYVDGVEITEGYTLVTDCDDNCTFEVRFENLKDIPAVAAGSVISVEYESILNENAVIGVPGNPNLMHMEYSNNPTDETSTGCTPDDKVVVFTYEVIIEKVDENGNSLPGAAFELYKWIPNDDIAPEDLTDDMIGNEQYGQWVLVPGEVNGETSATGSGRVLYINGKPVTEYVDNDGTLWYVILDKPNEESPETNIYLLASAIDSITPEQIANGTAAARYYENIDGVITQVTGNFSYSINSILRASTAGTTFSWAGIDDGHYKLVETQTPSGFNTIDPIIFDVTADHEIDSEDPQLLEVLGAPFVSSNENIGILVGQVINVPGNTLPETGGIGTTLFYVLGALLVFGAAVVLIVKKYSDA